MDSTEKKIRDAVEKTLAIPNKIQRVAGNPYLLTRIKARLQEGKNPPPTALSSHPWPVLLLVLLLLNSFVLFKTFPFSNNTENSEYSELFFPATDVDHWYEYSN